MKYLNILFDLDGTLSDSSEGVFRGIEFAFNKMGKELPPKSIMRTFIGPPLDFSFSKYFSTKEIPAVIAAFREYYLEIGLYQNKLYAGIDNLLKELRNRGLHLFVATSKGENSAKEILESFGVNKYFDYIYGADMDSGRKTKQDVLARLFKISQLDKSKTILVGDTIYDADGAKDFDIDCLAVTYGFGNKEDFLDRKIVALVDTPEEILEYLTK